MNSDYVAIIGDWPTNEAEGSARTSRLESLGLRLHFKSKSCAIYAPSVTPMIHLGQHGLLIGSLYASNGDRVQSHPDLQALAGSSDLRRYIIEKMWGDYVLFLRDPVQPNTITCSRSPSPACNARVYLSLRAKHGFITSSISLSEQLGLYRRAVDYDQVAHFLAHPGIRTTQTPLLGIQELLPGCTIRLADGANQVTSDWSPWSFLSKQSRATDLETAAESVRGAIQMVVRSWSAEDSTILLELSGGLDSSIIAACLRERESAVDCLTLLSASTGSDERSYARIAANMLGTVLHSGELRIECTPFIFEVPRDSVYPVIGPLQNVVDKTIQAAAVCTPDTALYSGGGGDTVFCYLSNTTPAVDAFLEAGISAGVRSLHELTKLHQCTYWRAAKLTARRLLHQVRPNDLDASFLQPSRIIPDPTPHPWLSIPPSSLPGDRQRVFDLSATQLFMDSLPRALTHRMRMPLLSQPVVEACLRVPSWMWIEGGRNRSVARHAFSDALPEPLIHRRSKGSFTTFLGAVYRQNLGQITEFLANGQLAKQGIIDASMIREFSRPDGRIVGNSFLRVLQLCGAENWVSQQHPPHVSATIPDLPASQSSAGTDLPS